MTGRLAKGNRAIGIWLTDQYQSIIKHYYQDSCIGNVLMIPKKKKNNNNPNHLSDRLTLVPRNNVSRSLPSMLFTIIPKK